MSKITNGDSRGVFYDLFDNEATAATLTVRSGLMIELREAIRKRKMTQKQIAGTLGLTQSRVSYIMTGRIDKFTIDKLINMLALMGLTVSTKVKKSRSKAA